MIAISRIPETSPPANPPQRSAQQIGLGPLGLATPRASNDALAVLVVANVTPTGYRVGKFLAGHVRYGQTADIRRKVAVGEIFAYWPQEKIAAALECSVRQVQRGIRSLRDAGVVDVRQRVRPCEASYVFARPVVSGVVSGVGSGVGSLNEPRTNHERTTSEPFKRVSARGTRTSVAKPTVKTAAPLKGSPLPSTHAETTEEPADVDVLRAIRQQFTARGKSKRTLAIIPARDKRVTREAAPSQAATDTTDGPASASALRDLRAQFKATQAKAKASRPITSPVKRTAKQAAVPEPDPSAPSTFTLDPDLEARFEEQDRLRQEQRAKRTPPPAPSAVGCPHCGHDRMSGGSCNACGYEDGTGFSPNPDYNAGL